MLTGPLVASPGLAGGAAVPPQAQNLVASYLAARNGVPETVLTDARGRPEPPAEIVAALQRMDPALGLRFASGSPGYWAFTLRWHANDRRHLLIQRQEMSPEDDFDMLGALPLDCPADQAVGYFIDSVKRWNGKEDVTRLLSRVGEWNVAQEQRNLAPALEFAEELLDANKGTMFAAIGKTAPKVRHGRGAKAAKAAKAAG